MREIGLATRLILMFDYWSINDSRIGTENKYETINDDDDNDDDDDCDDDDDDDDDDNATEDVESLERSGIPRNVFSAFVSSLISFPRFAPPAHRSNLLPLFLLFSSSSFFPPLFPYSSSGSSPSSPPFPLPSHLYKSVCPSVRRSVGPSVRPSVGHTRVGSRRNGSNLNKIASGT